MDQSNIRKQPTSYDVENEVESFHWWFVVRRKLLASILSSIHVPTNSLTLDIGCGAGSNLKVLSSAGINAIGIDRSIYAFSLMSKKLNFPLINGDLNEFPIRPEPVGLIIAIDVLEHLDNDLDDIRTLPGVEKWRNAHFNNSCL